MRSTFPLATLCTAAVLTLAACGSHEGDPEDKPKHHTGKPATATTQSSESTGLTELSGPEIINKAIEAMKSPASMRVKMDSGSGDNRYRHDVSSNRSGECVGRMGTGDQAQTQVIRIGPTVYVKYGAGWWKTHDLGGKVVEDKLADHWAKTDATSATAKDLTTACDSEQLIANLATAFEHARKGKVTTVNGQLAMTLTARDDTSTYTAYVAAEGKPYILKLAIKSKKTSTMFFSDFGEPVRATAPTGDILDLDAA